LIYPYFYHGFGKRSICFFCFDFFSVHSPTSDSCTFTRQHQGLVLIFCYLVWSHYCTFASFAFCFCCCFYLCFLLRGLLSGIEDTTLAHWVLWDTRRTRRVTIFDGFAFDYGTVYGYGSGSTCFHFSSSFGYFLFLLNNL
jgi:hypothetical protein